MIIRIMVAPEDVLARGDSYLVLRVEDTAAIYLTTHDGETAEEFDSGKALHTANVLVTGLGLIGIEPRS